MKRRKTREIMVGGVGVGGDNPVRIQSMTTSKTGDVEATIDQVMRLSDEGCEIARVTVQGKKEARACEQIKNGLLQKGYEIPLVADIHFYPKAAMEVIEFVDKVRVNPGNYVDRRAVFKTIEYNDEAYLEELKKIEEGFSPLVLKTKELGKAMRIGTNHGSLSDRIMNRYGDTPDGMVESALEFARVCRMHDFHDFCFSMKASNVLVMVEAYRKLVRAMEGLGWDYPLHLGVTEAGDGEDGRVKSAMGIGSLLLDGVGDTIRVSLTEDPWCEIEPCKQLVKLAEEEAKWGMGERYDRTHKVILPGNELPEGAWKMPLKTDKVREGRQMFMEGPDGPMILQWEDEGADQLIRASAELGSLLIDGIGDGIEGLPEDLTFKILQAARMHMSKTEFIACPGCGRTLFNLQEVTARIRAKTEHLPGVKLAIMGCIVNGPGEMADADFGYVGSKTGMIDLYVGKECVEKGIPEAEADDRLIELLKMHGVWKEPQLAK
ncbi:MAG: 4-hydroxy-3-methylbut-2-en-1-yl diphosphate synthase (ferredoxin) [Chlamydiia bacterium]|nr:4-hydroxy-3-methylbut-2-en-1-yl diphosphate synthase (ferredoxin) [Chlamydiia bacterium]MCH9615768.1 4-hydroxy-3-methylbut-2-en-1-yl diphosphate synthase (ferredoxin) [Chlamydiia bacterium]MCH9628829.1 4-hydroxy-3-methylbut-2-en-1-yl diphosphate synthase (ferredoxin) [Chlamydiia bacterium]